jgi:Ni/Co efflux regulator RcnB
MTTRALMEEAWGGLPTETSDSDGAYYRRWATEEFGAKSADELAGIYKDYFAAPSERTGFGFGGFGPPGQAATGNAPPPAPRSNVKREQGDNHYHSEVRRLIQDNLAVHQVFGVPSQSPKWTLPGLMPTPTAQMRSAALARDIKECEEAQPRWEAAWTRAVAAESLVDPDRRDYYQAELLTMITINQESNRMLLLVARAMQDADAGQADKASGEVDEAVQALDKIQKSMAAAEYGKWKNWYRGDWLTGVYRTRELVQDYANHLKDPMAKLPAPVSWSGWEAYFHIMQYEGDRSVDVH